ncbi:Tcp11-domain-containing protein [Pleurotus eryngii]|uniref:Tcp11-domain-containing protein n=1 Tax=Pleurotus eryngii TaxID=5323 RepID=A0A9P6A5P7_PLEER|nr:Tcp11-domain-containing protein [Pleurotus eryngii]
MDHLLPSLKRKSVTNTNRHAKRQRLSATATSFSLQPPPPSPTSPPSSPSLPIPPVLPFINRHTLKELDVSQILRNPHLRHDLLFDPGLQFRPTASRRKRDLADAYWRAVERELELGCTCVSFAANGILSSRILCACKQIQCPSSQPVLAFNPAHNLLTCRTPSRIRPLLEECRQILLNLIDEAFDDASTPSCAAQQASYLRQIFDPALIASQLSSTSSSRFDPSGLLSALHEILKSHCAPMRDSVIDNLLLFTRPESSKHIVQALRLIMDILELMKLDMANHQLQSLRPYLIHTAPQFEMKAFTKKFPHPSSSIGDTQITQRWLRAAHQLMLSHPTPLLNPLLRNTFLLSESNSSSSSSSSSSSAVPRLSASSSPLAFSEDEGLTDTDTAACSNSIHDESRTGSIKVERTVEYKNMRKNQQVYVAVLRGIVDLVFNIPAQDPASTSSASEEADYASSALPTLPETMFLDSSRVVQLATDVDEIHAEYMLGLLYKQLCTPPVSSRSHSRSSSLTSISSIPPSLPSTPLIPSTPPLAFLGGNPGLSTAALPPSTTPWLSATSTTTNAKPGEEEMKRMYEEIRDIAGSRLGKLVSHSTPAISTHDVDVELQRERELELEKQRVDHVREDVVLQIARRVVERKKPTLPSTSLLSALPSISARASSSGTCATSSTPATSPTSSIFSIPATPLTNFTGSAPPTPPTPYTPFTPSSCSFAAASPNPFPDTQSIRLAQRWTSMHMRKDAVLAKMTRRKLRDLVFGAVMEQVVLGRLAAPSTSSSPSIPSLVPNSLSGAGSTAPSKPTFGDSTIAGLSGQVGTLVEKIARLVEVHTNTYLGLYEREV